jgi:hypothetical protein
LHCIVSVGCSIADGGFHSYLAVNRHDFNREMGGEAFSDVRPSWQTESIMEEWAHYAQSQMSEPCIAANSTPRLSTSCRPRYAGWRGSTDCTQEEEGSGGV